jgi:hypothetical protein
MFIQLLVLVLAAIVAFSVSKIGLYPQNGKLNLVRKILLICLACQMLVAVWCVGDLRYYKKIKDYVPPKSLKDFKVGQNVTFEGVVSHDNMADEYFAIRYGLDHKFSPNPMVVQLEGQLVKVWKQGKLEVSNWKKEADGYYLERGDYVVVEATIEDANTANARSIVRGNYMRFVKHELQYIWFSYMLLILVTITLTYTAFQYARGFTF